MKLNLCAPTLRQVSICIFNFKRFVFKFIKIAFKPFSNKFRLFSETIYFFEKNIKIKTNTRLSIFYISYILNAVIQFPSWRTRWHINVNKHFFNCLNFASRCSKKKTRDCFLYSPIKNSVKVWKKKWSYKKKPNEIKYMWSIFLCYFFLATERRRRREKIRSKAYMAKANSKLRMQRIHKQKQFMWLLSLYILVYICKQVFNVRKSGTWNHVKYPHLLKESSLLCERHQSCSPKHFLFRECVYHGIHSHCCFLATQYKACVYYIYITFALQFSAKGCVSSFWIKMINGLNVKFAYFN